MIEITPQLSVPDSDYSITAVRSQGAGGQNVNKVATAVQLRFDILGSTLPDAVKTRLLNLDDRRVSQDGVLIIKSQESRSQLRNLKAAEARLATFIRRGLVVRKQRIATKPRKAAVQKRLDDKRRRSQVKSNRKRTID